MKPCLLNSIIRSCKLFATAVFLTFNFGLPNRALGQLAPDAGGPAADQAPAGFISILFSGGIVGAIMILILLALSMTAVYLIFDHLMTIRRSDLMPEGLSDQVRQSLMAGEISAAQEACNAQPSFLSFVLMHGISELEFGWNAVEKVN